MFNLKKLKPATFLMEQGEKMRVPGLIFMNDQSLQDPLFEEPLKQVRNVSTLPGIVGYSIAMPDIHWGYGFPIGGVAAFDAETGVISPGGVGYDINCGVRVAIIKEPFQSIPSSQKQALLKAIFRKVPSGVGMGESPPLTQADYKAIVSKGAKWSIEQGYGLDIDLEFMESHGNISGGDMAAVSQHAQDRGAKQLGSIGSGNHFVEIGEVQSILLPDVAAAWGIAKGDTYVLIHSGSRGFGHQICQETLDLFVQKGLADNLVDKQLACAPIKSSEGQNYFKAMAAAANYAFNNRQQILHSVRQAFKHVLHIPEEEVRLLYDVCHNIAKFETHLVDGNPKKLCVHRKGATRAFGPGNPELNTLFQATGQPVLVPGDMGRASYIMVGSALPQSWCSACHGAGRARSRVQSMKTWKDRNLFDYMKSIGVTVMAHSIRTIAEEMPDAYKNVDEVVQAVQEAELAKMVARLKPELVIKG